MLRTQNLCSGNKNVFDFRQNIFCFRAAKFVSATYVSRAAKLGNICVSNNVSATMFPSLAGPLRFVDFFMNSTRWLEEGPIIHTRYGESIGLFSIKSPKGHQVKALPLYHLLEKY